MDSLSHILATEVIEVNYCFASIGIYRGRSFLYRAERTVAIPSLPKAVLAEGDFYTGDRELSRDEIFTFGGRHFEAAGHWSYGKSMRLDEFKDLMSWKHMPKNGASGHPLNRMALYLDGIESVCDRFIPPDWIQYYGLLPDGQITHGDISRIYGGRSLINIHPDDETGPSFSADPPLSLKELGFPASAVDTSEADYIADYMQRYCETFYAVVDGIICKPTDEPCIRVHTSGKPGDKVFLSYSHGVLEKCTPAEPIVLIFRVDEIEKAQNAAAELAKTLDTKVVLRGSLDHVDRSALQLDAESTTWTGLASRLHEIMLKGCDYLPDTILRHMPALQLAWKGSNRADLVNYRYFDLLKAEASLVRLARDEWLVEWRALQESLGGRLRVNHQMNVWLSRFIVANEAIALAVANVPLRDYTDLDATPITSPALREVLSRCSPYMDEAGSAYAEAWIKLRRTEMAGEDVGKAMLALSRAPMLGFSSANMEKKWSTKILPLLEGASS